MATLSCAKGVLCTFLLFYALLPSLEGKQGDEVEAQQNNKPVLTLPDNYYTLHQDINHVTLRVNGDGKMEWDNGSPTLYSVFREQIVRSKKYWGGEDREEDAPMYTLEATATRYWICMQRNGRLYTVHQHQYYKMERRIRHAASKSRQTRWTRLPHLWEKEWDSSPPPPKDCIFKTFEFNPDQSYERSVGIYSAFHSNSTHGRFLSINRGTGEARSYRKTFSNLHLHAAVKISQVPIAYLRDMVMRTRFGRSFQLNGRVRQCIVQLLQCPAQQEKIRKERRSHFSRIIQRCIKRADRTEKPPKCKEKLNQKRLRRRKRRRKSVL